MEVVNLSNPGIVDRPGGTITLVKFYGGIDRPIPVPAGVEWIPFGTPAAA